MTQSQPIEIFYWTTPNGRKITVAAEEMGFPHRITFIDLGKREQWSPEFEAVAPNHQIPAIMDPEGPGGEPISIFESGAILLYLGRKFGKLFPQDERQRIEVEKWLIWQVASFGPFLGQAHHFNTAAPEKLPYAIDRYHKIAERLYAVLGQRLRDRPFVAGEDYSIADIAIFCWAARHELHRIDLANYPNVRGWFDTISARPAVRRGMAVTKHAAPPAKV